MQDASFHLAADDGGQDFRAEGALSTSAPSAWVPPRLSYWQLGCNDAKAGRPMNLPPARMGADSFPLFGQPEQDGYWNGYQFGKKSPDILAKLRGEAS